MLGGFMLLRGILITEAFQARPCRALTSLGKLFQVMLRCTTSQPLKGAFNYILIK